MAAHQVFTTTELLESILEELPMQDILRLQAVSRRWQATIAESSLLQQTLFLKPAKHTTTWLVDATNLPSGSTPLYRRYETKVRVKAAVSSTSDDVKSHHGLLLKPVQIHPLCFLPLPRMQPQLDFAASKGTPVALRNQFTFSQVAKRSSWLEMFLTQPPVQNVTLEATWSKRHQPGVALRRAGPPQEVVEKVSVEGGVRFRHVVDALIARGLNDEIALLFFREGKTGCVVHMHGALAATADDEELVRARTKVWRAEVAKREEMLGMELGGG